MEREKRRHYGLSVRNSNWHYRMQSYPLDNPNPNYSGGSHYRTFGESDAVYIPKTTTQELLESVTRTKFEVRQIAKDLINFVSYPMNDHRFGKYLTKEYNDTEKVYPMSTTYSEVYKAPRAIKIKKDCCGVDLDPLWNRIPKCDFEMLPSSTNKFMDDHLAVLSEGRKKINFFRQLRNATNILKNDA